MRLSESLQEDIIERFKSVMEAYKQLKSASNELVRDCETVTDLDFDSKYLYDFINKELFNRLDNMKGSILDKYYPIYDDSKETNMELASEKYKSSVEARNEIFKDYF